MYSEWVGFIRWLKCEEYLTADRIKYIIPSLTVDKRKNRYIPCICWAVAIFTAVTKYSNLFLPFTFFLDCSHFTFGYELIIGTETTDLMKGIRDSVPSV